MKSIKKLKKLLLVVLAVLVSCVEEYKSDFLPEKPAEVAMDEVMNQYGVLKSFISPGFMLGTGITANDFNNKGTLFSLTVNNFNEITPGDLIFHRAIVSEDGSRMDFGNVLGLVEAARQIEIAVFGNSLVWHANQSRSLDASMAPVVIPEIVIPPEIGTTVFFDFESDNIGDSYTMSNPATGVARIADDPKGVSGNVLHIYGPTEDDGVNGPGANQSFPEFEITLPSGRKLGDYVSIILDMHINDDKGIYGQGMMLNINGKEATYNSPSGFGCPNNNWGRGNIVLPVANLNLTDADKELTSFTMRVGSRTGGGNYYIDNIRGDYGVIGTGKTIVADFDDVNTFVSMINTNGVGTIVDDPAGESGKVLHIGGEGGPGTTPGANQSFPVFQVDLPQGRILGDYTTLTIDFRGTGSTGLFGQGMRMAINNRALTNYDSPSGFGCPDGNWGRGLINLPFATMNLTDAEKELTQFTLTVGSATGSGDYYIDNIVMTWESGWTIIPEEIIWKTAEEQEEILTEAMESWISGLMESVDGYVKSWNVINEPMDDVNTSDLKRDPNPNTDPKNWVINETFYWQDYLGKDYARVAVALTRKHGGNDLKLFVDDYGLETNIAKCEGLIEMIKYWESDGVTKIDGIGTQMHITYSMDPIIQQSNEDQVVEMLQKLAASGKLIRISELDMRLSNESGATVNPTNATPEQRTAMSKYYNFIVRKYIEIIPAAQRYGITHWNSVESATHVGLWFGSFNRKITYAGFADGLQGITNQ